MKYNIPELIKIFESHSKIFNKQLDANKKRMESEDLDPWPEAYHFNIAEALKVICIELQKLSDDLDAMK